MFVEHTQTHVEGLPGYYVKTMSALEYAQIVDLFKAEAGQTVENQAQLMAEIVSRCVVNDAGARLYPSVDAASAIRFENLRALSDAALRLNGIIKEGEEGNSVAGQ